jgi:O-antigen ligase
MLSLFNLLAIYFYFLSYILENIFAFSIINIKGLSLENLSFYFLLTSYLLTCSFRRSLIYKNNLYFCLILIVLALFASIPIKFLLDEIPKYKISILNEVMMIKDWIDPWLLFFFVSNIIQDKKMVKAVVFGLLLVLGLTIIGMILAVLGIAEMWDVYIDRDGRAAGFMEPNQYSIALLLFLPLLVSFLLFTESLKKRFLGLCFSLSVFLGLIFAASRGGFIAFVLSMSFYALLLLHKKIIGNVNIAILAILLPSLLIGSYMIVPSRLKTTIQDRINFDNIEDLSQLTSGRTILWEHGVEIFFESPIFGHGQDTFVPLLVERSGISLVSHNEYLMYLVEFGIIGCFLFITIYIQIFRQTLYSLRNTEDRVAKIFYISYLSGVVGYMIAIFGVNVYGSIRTLFWLYTAALYKFTFLENKNFQRLNE